MDPLVLAALNGDLDSVKTLIRDGADIDQSDYTCLMAACRNDNDDIVSYLIQSGADVNKTDRKGYSAIYKCAESGALKCMKLLVDNGADIKPSSYGYTPLLLACAGRKPCVVEYLLGSPSCTRADKIEALEFIGVNCVRNGDFESALVHWLRSLDERRLVEPGDVVEPTSQVTHPVYGDQFHTAEDLKRMALSKEDLWMQALIIMERINSHYFPNDDCYSVVRDAFAYLVTVNYGRCISIVMYIIEKHLQSLEVTDRWLHPLFILRRMNSLLMSKDPPEPYEVVMPLLTKGVQLTELAMKKPMVSQLRSTINNVDEILAFVFSSMGFLAKRQPEMLNKDHIYFKQIVYELVNMNPCDNRDRRLLHILFDPVDWSPFPCELVELLLEAGADPTVADRDKNTPLHLACKPQQSPHISTEVIKLLLEAGVDHGAINRNGETPLHFLCWQGDPSYPITEAVRLLLEAGANPQAGDEDGNTPMHFMALNSHPDKHLVIDLLLSKCCPCAMDVCNSDGQWFTDYLPSEMISEIEKSRDWCSLQCLSAKSVLTYSIPYESVLPTPLARFVKMHCSVKAGRTLLPIPLAPFPWEDFVSLLCMDDD